MSDAALLVAVDMIVYYLYYPPSQSPLSVESHFLDCEESADTVGVAEKSPKVVCQWVSSFARLGADGQDKSDKKIKSELGNYVRIKTDLALR